MNFSPRIQILEWYTVSWFTREVWILLVLFRFNNYIRYNNWFTKILYFKFIFLLHVERAKTNFHSFNAYMYTYTIHCQMENTRLRKISLVTSAPRILPSDSQCLCSSNHLSSTYCKLQLIKLFSPLQYHKW